MSRFLSIALLFLFLAPAAASRTRTVSPLEFLQPGQCVKVEGRLNRDRVLVARRVEVVADADDFEIEGPISRLDEKTGTFQIGPWAISRYGRTKFENARREAITAPKLSNGVRVKVKARKLENKQVRARTIRLYEGSQDTDIEILARLDGVNAARSEVALLRNRIRIEERTRFANLHGAGDMEQLQVVRSIRRDDDEQSVAPIRIGNVSIGGQVRFEHERFRNRDLDDRAPDAEDRARPNVEVEVSMPVGEYSELYTKMNFERPMFTGTRPGQAGRADFNVREAFFYWGNFLHPSLALQIGRQRFRDRREWLYDDQLDAVRLHFFPRSDLKFEFSAAKGLVGPTGSRSDQYHFIAHSLYRLPGRRHIGGYVMKRNDLTSRDEDPVWYGVSSRGPVWRDLSYWGELSRMKGRRGANLLRGYAWDTGGAWRFRLPLQPAVSAGYAFGSGDSNLDDGHDGNFRQTGLNDNSGRFDGIKRFRYYGILTEPDLTNLRIATLNVGVRRASDWSLDVAFHTYRQAVPARRFSGDIELQIRPSGRDARLGKEIDAVLAIRKIPRMDMNFYTGVFFPGPAFRGGAARAFLFRQEFKFYF